MPWSGSIEKVDGRFIAMINTNESGTRFGAPFETTSIRPLKTSPPSVLPRMERLRGQPSYRRCNWPPSNFEMKRKPLHVEGTKEVGAEGSYFARITVPRQTPNRKADRWTTPSH